MITKTLYYLNKKNNILNNDFDDICVRKKNILDIKIVINVDKKIEDKEKDLISKKYNKNDVLVFIKKDFDSEILFENIDVYYYNKNKIENKEELNNIIINLFFNECFN